MTIIKVYDKTEIRVYEASGTPHTILIDIKKGYSEVCTYNINDVCTYATLVDIIEKNPTERFPPSVLDR